VCPISLSVMEDPVLAGDGHSYDRASIELWLQSHAVSPITNLPLASATLIPNHALRSAIAEFREERAKAKSSPVS
jgi:hypothetical protein